VRPAYRPTPMTTVLRSALAPASERMVSSGLITLSDSRAAGKILRMQFPPLRCPLPRTCRLRRKWDILGAASSKACLVACGTRLPFYRHSAQALFNRVWIAIGRRGSLYAERVCRAMICSRSVNAESRRGNRITR